MKRTASLLVPALILSVSLAGCAGEDSSPGSSASPVGSPTADATSPSPSVAPSPSPSPSPTAQVIAVTVAGGVVTGVEPRVEVGLNDDVIIRVTSDIAEEVHLHGYDLSKAVAAGGTVEIPFTADIPGGFEVELEESGKTLFQLRVS